MHSFGPVDPLQIGPLVTNFSEILIEIQIFSLKKMHVKTPSVIFPPNHQGRCVNTLRPRQNGRHFSDDIFKWIFLNENVWISINISLKFVPRGPINNILTLVQIMAWRRPGDKPLSEPMMVRLPTHICVIRPQLVNTRQQGNQPIYTSSIIGLNPANERRRYKVTLFLIGWVQT